MDAKRRKSFCAAIVAGLVLAAKLRVVAGSAEMTGNTDVGLGLLGSTDVLSPDVPGVSSDKLRVQQPAGRTSP